MSASADLPPRRHPGPPGAELPVAPDPAASDQAAPDQAPADPAAAQLVVDSPARRVVCDGQEPVLTRREFELLEYLVDHPDRVFTRGQLLTAVWGHPDPRYASPRTVDVHVARLRRKLGAHSGALQTLRGVGYQWTGR